LAGGRLPHYTPTLFYLPPHCLPLFTATTTFYSRFLPCTYPPTTCCTSLPFCTGEEVKELSHHTCLPSYMPTCTAHHYLPTTCTLSHPACLLLPFWRLEEGSIPSCLRQRRTTECRHEADRGLEWAGDDGRGGGMATWQAERGGLQHARQTGSNGAPPAADNAWALVVACAKKKTCENMLSDSVGESGTTTYTPLHLPSPGSDWAEEGGRDSALPGTLHLPFLPFQCSLCLLPFLPTTQTVFSLPFTLPSFLGWTWWCPLPVPGLPFVPACLLPSFFPYRVPACYHFYSTFLTYTHTAACACPATSPTCSPQTHAPTTAYHTYHIPHLPHHTAYPALPAPAASLLPPFCYPGGRHASGSTVPPLFCHC